MTVIHIGFSETTDFYLEILRDAQMVEDKKLVRMVIQRLKKKDSDLNIFKEPAEIIPFPVPFSPPVKITSGRQLWPKFELAQMMIILTTYLLFVAGSPMLQ